jgi:hypothetical protein
MSEFQLKPNSIPPQEPVMPIRMPPQLVEPNYEIFSAPRLNMMLASEVASRIFTDFKGSLLEGLFIGLQIATELGLLEDSEEKRHPFILWAITAKNAIVAKQEASSQMFKGIITEKHRRSKRTDALND